MPLAFDGLIERGDDLDVAAAADDVLRMGEVRAADDADVVVACLSYADYNRLLERLRERGIGAVAGQVGPICRVQTAVFFASKVSAYLERGMDDPWVSDDLYALLALLAPVPESVSKSMYTSSLRNWKVLKPAARMASSR